MKYRKVYFKYVIKPEDSNFLASWNELREDESFQKRLQHITRTCNDPTKRKHKIKQQPERSE